MQKGLLSIGEFAKLRDINVKSLRYYERIGALAPAYVNPETGYRYYSINQLSDLDVVLTLIELGIPLKEIARYANQTAQNSINSLELIERGKALAKNRIARAQEKLLQLENYGEELEAFNAHAPSHEPYAKHLEKRLCLCRKLTPDFDMSDYARITNALYDSAPELGLVPLFSQGIIQGKISSESNSFVPGDNLERFAYLQVLPSPSNNSSLEDIARSCESHNVALSSIPNAEYSCKLIRSEDFNESFELGIDELRRTNELGILAEAWSASLSPNEFLFEIQIPQQQ